MTSAVLRKIDCIRLFVPDLDQALAFYRNQLGLSLIWRSETALGLGLSESDVELVLQKERKGVEIDFLVDSADQAAADFVKAGGVLLVAPFAIPIGRCAVVQDPWGNELVLLDMSKGRLQTDEAGNVIGNSRQ